MAYQFWAEKLGKPNLPLLRERLVQYGLVEFFPVEISEDFLTLGISIPFSKMDDPRFETEIVDLMTYFVLEQEFQVIDLYNGNVISADDIPGLAQKISG